MTTPARNTTGVPTSQQSKIPSHVRRGVFYCITLALFFAAIRGVGIDTSQAQTRLEPALVEKVAPVYPKDLKKRNIEGVVKATYTIDTDGRVVAIETLSEAHHDFHQAVEAALEQWRFEPPLMHGAAIRLERFIEVRFERPEGGSHEVDEGSFRPFHKIAKKCLDCPCKKDRPYTT